MPKFYGPRFIVEIPYGRFPQRMILTRKQLKARARIAEQLNQRPITQERTTELERQGLIYSAQVALNHKRIYPSNISYLGIYPEGKPLSIEPVRPQNAADHFLKFLETKAVDQGLVQNHPLLAAFLDAVRSQETEPELGLALAESLAKNGASELAICAGIYQLNFFGRTFVIRGVLRFVETEGHELFLRDVVASGLRLGIKLEIIKRKLGELETVLQEEYRLWRAVTQPWFGYYEVEPKDEQIIALINLARSATQNQDAKLLFVVKEVEGLVEWAEKRMAKFEGRGTFDPSGDKDYWAKLRHRYLFMVVPLAEELGRAALTGRLKDNFLKAFHPWMYKQIDMWFSAALGFNYSGAQRHMANVVRIIEEVGQTMRLLPPGAKVAGRVKSYFSIYENLVDHYEQFNIDLMPHIHDVFGVRVLVTELNDAKKVEHLMRHTFWGFEDAIGHICRLLPGFVSRNREVVLRRMMALTPDLSRLPRDTINRFRYFGSFWIQTHKEFIDRGYVKGVRNTINDPKSKVAYYYMLLATHLCVPFEAQITTFALEEENEGKSPHWEYKFLKQLRLEGMDGVIKEGDLTQRADGIYVVILDRNECQTRVQFVPKTQAQLSAFPDHQLVARKLKLEVDEDEGEEIEFESEEVSLISGDILIRGGRFRAYSPDPHPPRS